MKTLIYITIALSLLMATESWGQENSSLTNKKKAWLEKLGADSTNSAFTNLLPEGDGNTNSKYYQQAFDQYYLYRIFGYQHREKVFRWQLFSSKVIFVVVLLLVLIGIFFSYIQFKKSFQTGEHLQTDLEASAQGIKLSSPVLGVVILVISLLFFYLYLVYVYPIVETF